MPEWLKPTAEFGIGLQSAFILTNTFKCNTYTRSNEKYEITFSTVKSNYYEGYINVRPVKEFADKDNSYGTCFEIFVPANKKLLHELYPAAWDGKDYYDTEYEALRPLRHSAELLAQMALYLDTVIGEQLFPIHLTVKKNSHVTVPVNLTRKNRIKKLKYILTQEGKELDRKADTGRTEEKEDEFEKIVRMNFESQQAETIIRLFHEREWERSGKAWSFYYRNYLSRKNEYENGADRENEIVVEKTENAIALLDCRDGHLYYWDNRLCTFCLVNMVNFLALERRRTENSDKHCEKKSPNVRIYYKGILLEERELPGIGNELLQCIDIKGKLERGYINLSRKGFTERGKEHFLQEIYAPLLESILKMLKVMNRKHPKEVENSVRISLRNKVKVLRALTCKMEQWKSGEEQIVGVTDQEEWIGRFAEKRNRLLVMFKENVISITMLSFFAQKDIFEPLVEIGGGSKGDKENCWAEVIEIVQQYYKRQKNTDENSGEQTEEFWDTKLDNSVLFHIEHRSQVDLEEGLIQEVGESGCITFPDIFSQKNQFMIVSKRENRSASWKQYLTPIWTSEMGKKTGIIQCLEKYAIMESASAEKEEMEKRIQRMGKNALALADAYGKDSYGGSGAMNPGEYMQQYFLKWLLRYIPTVALFTSEDGNMRVNIIHGKTFPSVFMDASMKKLILQRILEDAENYDIQRFSIPAWQGLENLSCKNLPYSHYFVKRGYMAEESYSKVIFPFAKDELDEIDGLIHSEQAQATIHRLRLLKGLINVRQQLVGILTESREKVTGVLENIKDDQIREMMKKVYADFMRRYNHNDRRAQRVLDKVRMEYRSFVVHMLNQRTWETSFSLDDLERNAQTWEDIFIWLLLRVIWNDYNLSDIDLKEKDLGITEEKKMSLGRAWYYLLKNEYMQNDLNVIKYEKRYNENMEQGTGLAFEKRERILDTIEKSRGNVLRREYLQNYWMRYVSEIFELFRSMEEEQYQVMEGQADWEAIGKVMSRKEQERTDDADN